MDSSRNCRFFRCLYLLLLSVSLLPVQIFSQYKVLSFNTGIRSIPQAGNEIIIPFEGAVLSQVNEAVLLKDSEVLMRRRFSTTQYGLFTGKIDTRAYPKISVFRQPAGMGILSAITFKYYSKEVNNPDLDLPNVYFDNEFVYVENAARLFYFDSTWRKLDMIADRPSLLSINSEPQGADVYVDGILKGVTPWQSGPLFTSSVVVKARKDGYYIQESFVNLQGGDAASKNFSLSKKVMFADGSEVDPQAFTAENTESVEELELRIGELKNVIVEKKQKMKQALIDFESSYPVLQPKDEFEKTPDFNSRSARYEVCKDSALTDVKNEWQNRIASVDQAAVKVEQYKSTIESRIYSKTFSTDSLVLKFYDSDKETFPVSFNVTDGMFDFKLTGTLSIPVEAARELKQRINDGVLVVSYRNKTIKVQTKGQAVRRFYDFTCVKLKFKNQEYSMAVTIDFPVYMTGSEDWERIKEIKAQVITQIEQADKKSFKCEGVLDDRWQDDCQVTVTGLPDKDISKKPFSYLSIVGMAQDANVFVGDCKLSHKSNVVLKVEPGLYTITVTRPGYQNTRNTISTYEGNTSVYNIKYIPLAAILNLSTLPRGAAVEINGRDIGVSPLRLNAIGPGEYDIKLTHHLYNPIRRHLTLKAGVESVVNDTFKTFSENYLKWQETRHKAKFANLAFAGLGQVVVKRSVVSLGMLSSGLVSDALLGLSAYQYYYHCEKRDRAKFKAEEKYFDKRKNEDIWWGISTAVSSLLFRVITYKITQGEVYK